MKDPINEEIHKYREEHARRFNYDLNSICEDLRKREKASGRPTVSLPPKRTPRRSERSFHGVWQKAQSYPPNVSPEEIRRLNQSKDGHERLLGLFLMRRRITEGDPASAYLPLARQMIGGSDGNCRWQAAIVVGESIAADPDAVWRVVWEHGDSKDEDMRRAIACVLLEHLLESDFDKYFSLLRREVAKGRLGFLETLSMCLFPGEAAEDRNKKIAKYMRKATRGLPRKKHGQRQ